jgi:hypothetical protein
MFQPGNEDFDCVFNAPSGHAGSTQEENKVEDDEDHAFFD